MKRPLEDLEGSYGPLPDPLPLERLKRGTDYSVTPGGVARMLHAAIETEAEQRGVHGEWATLATGFPRDLAFGGFRLSSVRMPEEAKEGYGKFKEVVWEALNGLPPRMEAPFAPDPEARRLTGAFETWSRTCADRLLRSHAEQPFDVFYVNDWQHLPQGRMMGDLPCVMHFHAPFASWTPAGWKEYVIQHLRGFDAVVVSTRQYVRALEQAGLERPVYHVYPWLEPSDFPTPPKSTLQEFRDRFGIRTSDEVVLNVGRMDPVKGQDRLLRALPWLLKLRPDAKVVLVGNGSFSSSKKAGMGLSKGARWRAKLEALVRDLGVADRVVFTGHLRHQDVLSAFYTANVFAFPSVAEGFGLAVAEAWLAGKPIVTSPGAGIAELVRNGENGVVADPNDAVAFAHAIAGVLAQPDKGAAMGDEGRRTALAECDVRVGAGRAIDILETHAERRAAPPRAAPERTVRGR